MSQVLYCQIHPKEPIIKVSLDPDAPKLFFCHSCLEDNKVASLILYADVIPTLQSELLSLRHHRIDRQLLAKASELYTNESITKQKFTEQVSRDRKAANVEIDRLEAQTQQLLRHVRAMTQERLEVYATKFGQSVDAYTDKLTAYEQVIENIGKPHPTQQDLNNRLFETTNTAKVEKNLKQVLHEICAMKELKSDEELKKMTDLRDKLETIAENASLVPEKSGSEYTVYIEVLKTYMQAAMLEHPDEEAKEEKENKKEEPQDKQKDLSKDLFNALEGLNTKVEKSCQDIEALLQKKYGIQLDKPKYRCTVTDKGQEKVLGKAYKCVTCYDKYAGYYYDTDVICEGCFKACHKDHKMEYVDTREFVCQCQFTTGLECNLATDCTFKFSGRSYIRQIYYRCTTDSMGYGSCLCGYCVKNCHDGHTYEFASISSAFCDCPIMFNFCKHKRVE